MKKTFVFVLYLLLIRITTAQEVITIKDYSTFDQIKNATIVNRNGQKIHTGIDGKADLAGFTITDSIRVIHPDYFIWTGVLKGQNEIFLMSRSINLNEVVLSATRTQDSITNVPYHMSIINQRGIEFTNSQTSADLIQNMGVMVQRSQSGGGSPILRGFEASRVLLVIDGVRMNNAIYRTGHLQDVMTIDNSMLEKTEVVFGPSSVAYGSDALGGVMHFYTKNAQFSNGNQLLVKVNSMMRYSSANREKTGHLDFNIGTKKIAFLTNITWSDFEDLMSGRLRDRGDTAFGRRYYYVERLSNRDSMMINRNPELQRGSGYRQLDFMQRINIQQNEKTIHGINFQLSQNNNLPRYDRLTDMSGGNLKWAEWWYKQNRILISYNLWLNGKTRMYDNARIISSYQKIEQQRNTRIFQNDLRTTQTEYVGLISFNADFSKSFGIRNAVKYGFEFTHNDVQSVAEKRNIVLDTAVKAKTRYPDGGSTFTTGAVYINDHFKINDKLHLNGGIRFSYVQMKNLFSDTTSYPFPFRQTTRNNTAMNGNLALIYKPGNDWQINTLFSTGFRVPNVDDATKIFESNPGLLIIPNEKLKPEYAYNTELGINKTWNNKLRVSAVFFYTLMDNAIVTRDATYNGKDSVFYDGVMSKVQSQQNADQAFVYGTNLVLVYDVDENFSLKSILNTTTGTYYNSEKRNYLPLDHIAPTYGQTSLTYRTRKFECEFFSRYSAAKKLEDYSPNGEDNLNYATANGMPGWTTFNLRSSWQINKNFRATLSVENITDRHYRVFASGISSPGRNVLISFRYKM
jgi:hemoglobin/transferrin/lactoferrin receptor protein